MTVCQLLGTKLVVYPLSLAHTRPFVKLFFLCYVRVEKYNWGCASSSFSILLTSKVNFFEGPKHSPQLYPYLFSIFHFTSKSNLSKVNNFDKGRRILPVVAG